MPPLPHLLLLLATILVSLSLLLSLLVITLPALGFNFGFGFNNGHGGGLATRTPSLFPRSAIITLTDDVTTFFLARPAAFGPELPEEEDTSDGSGGGGGGGSGGGRHKGLTGRLVAVPEGEDGCGEGEKSPGGDDGEGGDFFTVTGDSAGGELRWKREVEEDEGGGDAYINGRIVLLPRGGCGFMEKVLWAQRRGALAVIVGDNVSGRGLVTMYAKGDTSGVTIPSIFTTHTTAQLLISLIPRPPVTPTLPTNPTSVHSGRPGFQYENLERGRARVIDIACEGGEREGLWVTLTSTPGPASPFLDTLLVLVVSPLGTLGIVYMMLAIRARLQRRRWRAPKSVVESLPVRVYTEPRGSTGVVGGAVGGVGVGESRAESSTEGEERKRKKRKKRLCGGLGGGVGASGGASGSGENSSVTRVVTDGMEAVGPADSAQPLQVSQPSQPSQQEQEQPPKDINKPSTSNTTNGSATPSPTTHSPQHNQNIPSSSLECVVCLEEYIPNVSRVMRLPCGHEYHVGCITPWLVTRRRTCPICKGDVVKMVREKGADADGDPERGEWMGEGSSGEENGDEDGGEEEVGAGRGEREGRGERLGMRGWLGRVVAAVGGGRGRSVAGLSTGEGRVSSGGSSTEGSRRGRVERERPVLQREGPGRSFLGVGDADETTPLMTRTREVG